MLLFRNFSFTHFSEYEVVLANISHAKVIHLGHGQTFCWADRCAEPAKAALAHIDVEPGCVDALGCAIGGLPNFFDGPDGLDVDAINGTDFCALVANYAVVDFIVKAVPAVVRHGLHLIGILNSGDAGSVAEILRRLYGHNGLRLSGSEKVAHSQAETAK